VRLAGGRDCAISPADKSQLDWGWQGSGREVSHQVNSSYAILHLYPRRGSGVALVMEITDQIREWRMTGGKLEKLGVMDLVMYCTLIHIVQTAALTLQTQQILAHCLGACKRAFAASRRFGSWLRVVGDGALYRK
jgi:hypothetical protein